MTCENCLMFTHCRYDLHGDKEPCENFKDKSKAVAVVRCGDCRAGKKDLFLDGFIFCCNNGLAHKPDHYCSYGEYKLAEVEGE